MGRKYEIRLRRKNPDGGCGEIVGRMGDYSTQKEAKRDAQSLADGRTFKSNVQITVEPKRRKNSAVSRGRALSQSAAIAQRTGRLYNPRRRNTGWQGTGPVWTHSTGAAYGRWPAGGWFGVRATGAAKRFPGKGEAQTFALGGEPASMGQRVQIPAGWLSPKKRKRRNPKKRRIMGHDVTGTTGRYVIQPYGVERSTLEAVKSWLRAHLRRERGR